MTGISNIIPANVVVLGGGSVGANAVIVANGLNARMTILKINIDRKLNEIMPKNVNVAYSNEYNIRKEVKSANLIMGAVLALGRAAPKLGACSEMLSSWTLR